MNAPMKAAQAGVPVIGPEAFRAMNNADATYFERMRVRKLEAAQDDFARASEQLWDLHEGEITEAIAERVELGETVAAQAWRIAGMACSLNLNARKPERGALAAHIVAVLLDDPLDMAISDGVARAAAEAQLERLT